MTTPLDTPTQADLLRQFREARKDLLAARRAYHAAVDAHDDAVLAVCREDVAAEDSALAMRWADAAREMEATRATIESANRRFIVAEGALIEWHEDRVMKKIKERRREALMESVQGRA